MGSPCTKAVLVSSNDPLSSLRAGASADVYAFVGSAGASWTGGASTGSTGGEPQAARKNIPIKKEVTTRNFISYPVAVFEMFITNIIASIGGFLA
jgi:hypothetical protein